jgi:prepilin-type N-terminal cleavage/methylation domain-containing protein
LISPWTRSYKEFRAFTLVELLVVIAIIGVLTGLLLPAVQAARESSRLAYCRNSVGQLAKGLIRLESSMNGFPSGGWGNAWLGVPERGMLPKQPGGWTFAVLPYIEEEAVYDSLEGVTSADADEKYSALAAYPVKILTCPTRRPARALPVAAGSFRSAASLSVPISGAFRSDYAANAGTAAKCPPLSVLKGLPIGSGGDTVNIEGCHNASHKNGGGPINASINGVLNGHVNHDDDHLGPCGSCEGEATYAGPADLATGDGWTRDTTLTGKLAPGRDNGIPELQTGVIYRLSRIMPDSIRDGLSNTYLVGEKCVEAGKATTGAAEGDQRPAFVGYSSDNIRWAHDLPQRDTKDTPWPNAFGSAHYAGWSVAYADGSVRTLSFDIDPEVHKLMAGRADGEVRTP